MLLQSANEERKNSNIVYQVTIMFIIIDLTGEQED